MINIISHESQLYMNPIKDQYASLLQPDIGIKHGVLTEDRQNHLEKGLMKKKITYKSKGNREGKPMMTNLLHGKLEFRCKLSGKKFKRWSRIQGP